MNRVFEFEQGDFIGGLPAPNNMGVCFSLSVHWLASESLFEMLDSIALNAELIYAQESAYSPNQIQVAANQMAMQAEGFDMELLIAVVQVSYPNVAEVVPIGGGAVTAGAIADALTEPPFPWVIIWLMQEDGRGHVVAVNFAQGLFFDANSGVYISDEDLIAEIAEYMADTYGDDYPQFMAFALNIV